MAKERLWIVLLAAVCMVGCRPRGVLSSSQMRDVIYDLHKADAVLSVAGYAQGGYAEESKECYRSVMEKHGITQAEFDSSLVWYTNHPSFFDKIYPKLEARVEAEAAYWEKKEIRERERMMVSHGYWRRELPNDMQLALLNIADSCVVALPPTEGSDFGDFSMKMRIFVKKSTK